jgi:hypothetical protein
MEEGKEGVCFTGTTEKHVRLGGQNDKGQTLRAWGMEGDMSLSADLEEQKECGLYLGRSRFFLGK